MPARARRLVTASLTAGPKTASGRGSGVTSDELEVADVHALGALGGHQRELVERQRPDRADGLDERELAGVAALDVLDDPVVGWRRPRRRGRSRRARTPRPAAHRPRPAARRTRRAVRRRCERPARRGRPTPASPVVHSASQSRCDAAAAGSAAAARRRTARAPPSAGRRARRSGRSARCPPSRPPVAAGEADPRPLRCRRHRSLRENRSCPDRTADDLGPAIGALPRPSADLPRRTTDTLSRGASPMRDALLARSCRHDF